MTSVEYLDALQAASIAAALPLSVILLAAFYAPHRSLVNNESVPVSVPSRAE